MAEIEGFQAITLASGRLQATFVPHAGMLCCSLRHDGIELLARRGGVRAYAERGSTMGIPLLHPWANRLAALSYPGANGPVRLAANDPLLKLDPNGLPIHGAIPGTLPWELIDSGSQHLHARLSWERSDLLAIFPFAHMLDVRVSLGGARIRIETSLTPGAEPVPVCFGYHPYLSLPGGERDAWKVELPVRERLRLDQRMIPSGASEPVTQRSFQLAAGDWDAAFAQPDRPAVFAVSNGSRRIELEFERSYAYAQLYAPAGQDFVCFEPMTAQTNALISRRGLTVIEPGGAFHAAFSIAVS